MRRLRVPAWVVVPPLAAVLAVVGGCLGWLTGTEHSSCSRDHDYQQEAGNPTSQLS
jgi:hypothetical protein